MKRVSRLVARGPDWQWEREYSADEIVEGRMSKEKEALKELVREAMYDGPTPGPWLLATSNSWRRFVALSGGSVCEPIKQNDGHPDLWFRNPADALLIAAAPDLLAALIQLESLAARLIGPESSYYELTEARAAIAKATGGAA